MRSLQKDFRIWMLRGLFAVAGSIFVLAIAAILWGLLALLGDEIGAGVARGISLAAGIAGLAILAALVVLLTWDRITAGEVHSVASGTGVEKNMSNGMYGASRSA
jgi:hypothetical protein